MKRVAAIQRQIDVEILPARPSRRDRPEQYDARDAIIRLGDLLREPFRLVPGPCEPGFDPFGLAPVEFPYALGVRRRIEVRHRLSAASHRHFPLLDARRSRYLGYRATILSCEVTLKPSLPCPLRSPCETLDIFCRRSSQRRTPLAYASRELVLAAGYVYEIHLEGRVLRRGDKPRDIAALEGQIDV